MFSCSGSNKLSSEHSQQQSIEYYRNNLRGRIQGKNNEIRSNIELVGVVEKEKRNVQFLEIKQK